MARPPPIADLTKPALDPSSRGSNCVREPAPEPPHGTSLWDAIMRTAPRNPTPKAAPRLGRHASQARLADVVLTKPGAGPAGGCALSATAPAALLLLLSVFVHPPPVEKRRIVVDVTAILLVHRFGGIRLGHAAVFIIRIFRERAGIGGLPLLVPDPRCSRHPHAPDPPMLQTPPCSRLP